MAGSKFCREHQNSEARRRAQRKRRRTARRLAVVQGWTCTWCERTLPEDLAGIHIDHIIPKASGFVIEDEWNLQVLHDVCNLSKSDRITPQALALAAEHGITLTEAA
jgi:5-methylcytosine-specific restriction endonuclease McrA